MNLTKRIKTQLTSGLPTIGSWMQLPNTSVAEIMGKAGYDWVAVDLEHGAFSLEKLPDIFRALELGGTAPFARVAQNHPKDIKHALDAGAQGLIVPMINSRKETEQAISWAYYPPLGVRGVGYSRANLFGKDFDRYIREDSGHILMIAQIEHIDAINSLDEILSVNGLDGIIVGPYDLSGSMNLTAQFDHPEFTKIMQTIKLKAQEHKVPFGMHIVQPDPQKLRSAIDEGYQFIAYSIDAVFLYRSAQIPEVLGE
jgi:2-dehydro-3-deoxyglucarate aldolase